MSALKIVHLSYASDSRDGGIFTALSDLIQAQKSADLSIEWQTVSGIPRLRRDSLLFSKVSAGNFDVAHLHGLWRAPTRIAARLSASSLPLVIAPHGMLAKDALAISRRKKQLIWRFWEYQALQHASCLHALSPAEAAVIRDFFPRSPIAVIPNCVRIAQCVEDDSRVAPPWVPFIPAGDSVLLFLGRFHPIKGLDPLLTAWQSVIAEAERHRFWLVLVGYGDEGALSRRVSQAQEKGELARVRVFGPVFGPEKEAALAAASAFVLPSFSEALPMAALEAMAHKRPVLLSTACNLPEAFSMGAALPAEPDPAALSISLQQCFRLSAAERKAMGIAGHSLVRERFSLPQVVAQSRELYSWVSGGGTPPAFVELG